MTNMTGFSGNLPTVTRSCMHLDPKDLPKYQLQPLMEGLADDDITSHKQEELAAAIYEYRDVFNSGTMHCFPSLSKMWKNLKFRKCWTEVLSGQSSCASPVVFVTEKDCYTRFIVKSIM